MSKEAMKLALQGAANYIDALGGDSRKYRQALAEQPAPVQQTIHCKHRLENNGVCPHHNLQCGWPKCNEPEQPAQQEPVAWMHEWEDGERIPMLTGRDDRNNDQPKSVRPLVYGDTPQAQPAQRKPLTDELDVERLNHCMIAVRDWLGGGCDINDIPRPEIAALVAFTDYGIKGDA